MNLRGRIGSGLLAFFISTSAITFAGEMERPIINGRTARVNDPLLVPNYLADQDFFQASHTFLEPLRVQQVYSASEFRTGPILITGIYWRPCADPQYGFPFHSVLPDFQVNLSTTSRQPDQLSLIFAENTGPDEKVVFKGRLAISSRFQNSAGNTKKFDIFVPLKHPFVYNPQKGNLLLDTRCFQASNASYVGEYGAGDDAGSRVYSLDPNSTTASVADTGIDVIELVFTRLPTRPLLNRVQFSK